jgi:hypothetical protein
LGACVGSGAVADRVARGTPLGNNHSQHCAPILAWPCHAEAREPIGSPVALLTALHSGLPQPINTLRRYQPSAGGRRDSRHSSPSPEPQAASAETGWTVHVPLHRLAILGRWGSNRSSHPTLEPAGQSFVPEAKRPAFICWSDNGVRIAVGLRPTAASRRSRSFTGAERWPRVAHHLLRAGARQGRDTGESVLRRRCGVGDQHPRARAHACISLASCSLRPRCSLEAQAGSNLAIVSARIEKPERLPSLDADGSGCRLGRGAEATMPGHRVVVPVPQSSIAADRQIAHAP